MSVNILTFYSTKLIRILKIFRFNQMVLETILWSKIKKYNDIRTFWTKGSKLNGKCNVYNDDGTLDIKCYYINGKREGHFERYHSNGKIWLETSFINDQLHGYYKSFDKNGHLVSQQLFKNGSSFNNL